MNKLTENNNDNKEQEPKNPRLFGATFIMLGITGFAFSIYGLAQSLEMVPLYGTVTAGILVGLLSIIIIIYGYRVFIRDY